MGQAELEVLDDAEAYEVAVYGVDISRECHVSTELETSAFQ